MGTGNAPGRTVRTVLAMVAVRTATEVVRTATVIVTLTAVIVEIAVMVGSPEMSPVRPACL